MGRYDRKRHRTSQDSPRDLVANLIALIITAGIMWGVWTFLSQPGAWGTFGVMTKRTPTPIPSVGNIVASSTPLNLLGIAAVFFGGGGLVVLGILWVATRQKQPAPIPAAPPPKPATPSPSAPTSNDRTPQRVSNMSPASPIAASPVRRDVIVAPTASAPAVKQPPTPLPANEPASVIPPAWSSEPTTVANHDPFEPEFDEPENPSAVTAKCILTNQERSFFWTLYHGIKDRYYIFPQIMLRELVPFEKYRLPRDLQRMWQDGIADFVLADLSTLETVAVIELDDPSHQQADAQARDRRKDRFLQIADIPLLRFPTRQKWSAASIQQSIAKELGANPISHPFMTVNQVQLFRALREIRGQDFVFPRVSLKQAIRRSDWLPLNTYQTLQDETIDFLIAHPNYLGTLMVIEMGDGDMRHPAKMELLTQAGIPWLIVEDAGTDKAQLRARMQEKLVG